MLKLLNVQKINIKMNLSKLIFMKSEMFQTFRIIIHEKKKPKHYRTYIMSCDNLK